MQPDDDWLAFRGSENQSTQSVLLRLKTRGHGTARGLTGQCFSAPRQCCPVSRLNPAHQTAAPSSFLVKPWLLRTKPLSAHRLVIDLTVVARKSLQDRRNTCGSFSSLPECATNNLFTWKSSSIVGPLLHQWSALIQ